MTLAPLLESKLFASALKVAGPAFFLGMQASSVKTALTIIADKSVKSLSPIPFVSLLTNCVIWTFYGLLRKDNTVLVPNAAGVLSGAFCVSAYRSHETSPSTQVYTISGLIIAFAIGCALIGNYKLLGSVGCALAVCLMASPLATLRTVIKDKSTASLPFATSFTGNITLTSALQVSSLPCL